MQYFMTILAACTALAAAQPAKVNSAETLDVRGDPLLGDATCGIDGSDFWLNKDDSVAGASWFATWVGEGANGQVDVSGNFKGQLSYTYKGIVFFACDYKSGDKGSYITTNLVKQVLNEGGWLDSKCGTGNAAFERSNDLAIGRTHDKDANGFC